MMFRSPWMIVAFATLMLNPLASNADLIWSESADGTLSQDPLNPTNLGVLLPGQNSVRGAIERTAQGNYDVDLFRFNIPIGSLVTSIKIPYYESSDMIAVVGINNDVFFPYNQDPMSPLYFPDQNPPVPLIIGFAAFGLSPPDGQLPFTTGSDAHNLLDFNDPQLSNYSKIGSRANAGKPFGAIPGNVKFNTLGPGDYTFLLQQSGDNTIYEIEITVAAVPEPTSIAMVGLALTGLTVLRRKRR